MSPFPRLLASLGALFAFACRAASPPFLTGDEGPVLRWDGGTDEDWRAYLEHENEILSANPLGVEVRCVLEIHAVRSPLERGGVYLRPSWVGDVDGDRMRDVALLPTWGSPSNSFRVYSGRDGRPLREVVDEHGEKRFFVETVSLGDVDADGCDDFAGTSFDQNRSGYRHGRVIAFSGKSGTVLWQRDGDAREIFGLSIANVGDVDGDGRDDLAVGSPPEPRTGDLAETPGHAFVLSGRDGTTLLAVEGNRPELDFGVAVEGIGDIDGDARLDIAVVAQPLRRSWCGPLASLPKPEIVFVSGRTGAVIGRSHADLAGDGGRDTSATFISALRGRYDIDGDGVPDLLTSPWSHDGLGELRSGRTGDVLQRFAPPPIEEYEAVATSSFGAMVDVIDDLDGDGWPDIVVGHPWFHLPLGPIACTHLYSSRTGQRLLTLWTDDHGFGSAPRIVGSRSGRERREIRAEASFGARIYAIERKSAPARQQSHARGHQTRVR